MRVKRNSTFMLKKQAQADNMNVVLRLVYVIIEELLHFCAKHMTYLPIKIFMRGEKSNVRRALPNPPCREARFTSHVSRLPVRLCRVRK